MGDVEDAGDGRSVLLRVAAAGLSSLIAAGIAAALSARPLDIALYAVLAPIAAVALLMAVPRVALVLRGVQRGPAVPSVVPEPPEPHEPPRTPMDLTLTTARERLVAAGPAGGELSELLALSAALHEAALDVARTTLAEGGDVPQELRDELALRDRADSADSTARQT